MEVFKMTKSSKKVEKKDAKKKEKVKNNDGYFKEVKKELKLVKWPSAKEVIKYTISTIILCAILCAIFMLLNLIMSVIVGGI